MSEENADKLESRYKYPTRYKRSFNQIITEQPPQELNQELRFLFEAVQSLFSLNDALFYLKYSASCKVLKLFQ